MNHLDMDQITEEVNDLLGYKEEASRQTTVSIPAWTESVHVVTNAIDGYALFHDGVYTVADFLAKAEWMQKQGGRGEWDALIYAVAGSTSFVHPYGSDHPYRKLRSRGGRVKLIATFSYMHWDFYTFTSTP